MRLIKRYRIVKALKLMGIRTTNSHFYLILFTNHQTRNYATKIFACRQFSGNA